MRPVSNTYTIILIIFAIIFDAFSFVPAIAEITAVVGQIFMAILFYFAGVNILKAKPLVLYTISTIVELIPAIGTLPMFLVETIAIIAISRHRASYLG